MDSILKELENKFFRQKKIAKYSFLAQKCGTFIIATMNKFFLRTLGVKMKTLICKG